MAAGKFRAADDFTDLSGNQTIYDCNANEMPVRVEVGASRKKNSREASSYITRSDYNAQNQLLLII